MRRRLKNLSTLTLDELEDIALYFALFVVIVLELVRSLAPAVDRFLPNDALSLYACMLLLFRIFVKKIGDIKQLLSLRQRAAGDFNEHIRGLVRTHARARTVDFLATNTRKFYHAIEDLHFFADHIRVLIYKGSPDIESIVSRWKALQERGICNTLQIRAYTTTPTFYALIIDKKEGCFGFFDPGYIADPATHLGTMQITGPYVLTRATATDQSILVDVGVWFDELFEHHTEELYDSSPHGVAD